jgi:hypothetical protein
MTAALKLSDEQAETVALLAASNLPVATIARIVGIRPSDLRGTISRWGRFFPNGVRRTNGVNSLARRIARVERIKAHIAAMPGIPMTIASEAIE